MTTDNAVGPILRMCDEVDTVVDAIREDNPDTEIEIIDRGSYVRVRAAGRLIVTETTLQRYLGPGFQIRSLEGMLASFAGRITTSSDRIEWRSSASSQAAAG